MNRSCYAMLGTDCVNQSSAATSNDKFLLPSVVDSGCTNMYEYPCQKCEYSSRKIRLDLDAVNELTRRVRSQSNSTRSLVRRN